MASPIQFAASLDIPIDMESLKEADEDVGGVQARAFDGTMRKHRRGGARKRNFSFDTSILSKLEGDAWAGLFAGEGHYWNFESATAYMYSSKGLVMSPVAARQTTNPKNGVGHLQCGSGSTTTITHNWARTDYAVSLWRDADAVPGGAAYQHWVFNVSTGQKWVDGVATAVATTWFSASNNSVTLAPGGVPMSIDSLHITPFLWPDSWPAAVASWNGQDRWVPPYFAISGPAADSINPESFNTFRFYVGDVPSRSYVGARAPGDVFKGTYSSLSCELVEHKIAPL